FSSNVGIPWGTVGGGVSFMALVSHGSEDLRTNPSSSIRLTPAYALDFRLFLSANLIFCDGSEIFSQGQLKIGPQGYASITA
ncbi:MAG: hypothetical protein Q4Q03_02495, partial [Bowdeniella nasicola]|nr:hypothetical protein [Bowdeniella nasicola]